MADSAFAHSRYGSRANMPSRLRYLAFAVCLLITLAAIIEGSLVATFIGIGLGIVALAELPRPDE